MALQIPPPWPADEAQLLSQQLVNKRVAVVCPSAGTAEQGGAERFYAGLLEGLARLGCIPTLIPVSASERTTEEILDNYAQAAALDLSNYDMVISTKVPSYAVTHPHHVVYLVHTVRAFDDMFDAVFPKATVSHRQARAAVHALDFAALQSIPKRFAIGAEVEKRLRRWRGLDSVVLHPPLLENLIASQEPPNVKPNHEDPYLFIPGRLHPWKRLDLLIQALQCSASPLRLLIAGEGEARDDLMALAKGDPRIVFLGRIDDAQLLAYYRGAVAIPFVPLREDYGYVTLEAFACGKPVITCSDSGEPARIVRAGQTGWIMPPTPQALAAIFDAIYRDPDHAKAMGEAAQREVQGLSWAAVALELCAAAMDYPARKGEAPTTAVAVIDMQPIDPPIGGGRQRLLGLYHGLGADLPTRYVGSYDWPGEVYREHALSPTLTEIDVPLSSAHFAAADALAKAANGKVVIDLAFSAQGHLSPEYLARVRTEIANAQVVVFSHPWVFPLVSDALRADHVVIYDAQNVEGYLRAQLLNPKDPIEAQLLERVCADEQALGERADWIVTCSHEDLQRFFRVYGFSPQKMRVAPNGVMAYATSKTRERQDCRSALGLATDQTIAIFLGSAYGPNREAAHFIVAELASAMPAIRFVIAGGVSAEFVRLPENVIATGNLSEAQKEDWLAAADFALNPMFSGSGTNIKMFDFMASGLPVITTAIGARGIETSHREAMLVVDPTVEAFVAGIARYLDRAVLAQGAHAARACVQEGYAWEHLSVQLGQFMTIRARIAGQSLPRFSVVIPSYERHAELERLMTHLQAQVERDFEVVVIDQSANPWPKANDAFGFLLNYYHSPVKGAVRARNTGAMLAQGEILAFIDDDCIPDPQWLLNARPYFDNPDVLGIEGLISSDHFGDPDWRPVSNVGSEGIGFMTANLMVRSAAFQYLGGFDLRFDRPHFREDTDFGWRMLDLGMVPYAEDVAVFHPAQRRTIERESFAARAHFFEKDALLYQKHPERYRTLFEFERHYERTPGFNENLLRGFALIGQEPPKWLLKKTTPN